MPAVTFGDLAQSHATRRQNAALKTEMAHLSQELATGRKAALRNGASGDYGPLAGIERALKANGAFTLAVTEASQLAAGMQAALQRVQAEAAATGARLLSVTSPPQPLLVGQAVGDAEASFRTMTAALNTRLADRSLFAGAATDRTALADADAILSAVRGEIAGETTAAGVISAVDAWFAPGGGFDTLAYRGSGTPLGPFDTGDGDRATLAVTAADPALRETLAAAALAAIADSPALAATEAEQQAVLRTAAERSLTADSALSVLRASIGTAEETLEKAGVRLSAEALGLEQHRAALIAVDPYDAASALTTAQTQLETLYAMTARLSRLSLAEYLR